MQATHTTFLRILELSRQGKHAYLFPKLEAANVLNIGLLCHDGCDVKFNKKEATVMKNGQTILKGIRNNNNGTWETQLPLVFHNYSPSSLPSAAVNGIIK